VKTETEICHTQTKGLSGIGYKWKRTRKKNRSKRK